MKMKLKRFSQPRFLQRISRDLLARFLERFTGDLAASGFALPPPDLPAPQFCDALAALAALPEKLPGPLNDALFALDELSTPAGLERIEQAPEWPSLRGQLRPDSTREDIALQLWFVAPEFLARVHNVLRLKRLTAFEHAGTTLPPDRRPPFDPTDHAAIVALTTDLDAWFVLNCRGAETTRIEVYPLDGAWWFLIRHGDVFTRTPKVEQQNTEILHFRPERDDVVVYWPALDELRVNARTKGERELYFRQFGQHLRGSADYFSNRLTYTLEPLREDGAAALDVRALDAIESIRLRELEVAGVDRQSEVITRAEQGLFEWAAAGPGSPDPIPRDGRLARAIFEIQFTGSARSYPVEIRVPNVLKVGRRCDSHAVEAWLTHSRIRRTAPVLQELIQ